MKSVGEQQELPHCCGIVEFGSFDIDYDGAYWWDSVVSELTLGLAGLACAAFVDSDECLLAYEKLKSMYNIVYQSSVRENTGSGNKLFFVVYDGVKKGKRK